MAASLLLRAARGRQLASPLGTLAANVQPTCVANVCSRWGGFARTFSAKPTGNEVNGTDLEMCVAVELYGGETDYTEEMWAKDQEEIKRLKSECEEHMRAFRKQMDALSELERCDARVQKKLARVQKKLDRIERVCYVGFLVVGILNIMF